MEASTESTSGPDIAKSMNTTTVGKLTASDLGKRLIIVHPNWGPISGRLRQVSHSKLMGSSMMMDQPQAMLDLDPDVEVQYVEETNPARNR